MVEGAHWEYAAPVPLCLKTPKKGRERFFLQPFLDATALSY